MNLSVAIACAWIVLGTWAPIVEGSSPPSGATWVLVVATCNVEDIVVTLLGIGVPRVGKWEVAVSWQGRAGRGTGTLVVSAR